MSFFIFGAVFKRGAKVRIIVELLNRLTVELFSEKPKIAVGNAIFMPNFAVGNLIFTSIFADGNLIFT